jgi:hypothetical protein
VLDLDLCQQHRASNDPELAQHVVGVLTKVCRATSGDASTG